MRAIHWAQLDKKRPVVVMTREAVRGLRSWVTVVPITHTVRGLTVEVPVGAANGLDDKGGESVANCDNIQTIRLDRLLDHIGFLLPDEEEALAEAVIHAFALEV